MARKAETRAERINGVVWVEEAVAAWRAWEDDKNIVPECILRDLIEKVEEAVLKQVEGGIEKAWANQDPIAIPCPECKGIGSRSESLTGDPEDHLEMDIQCHVCCHGNNPGTLTATEHARYQWEQAADWYADLNSTDAGWIIRAEADRRFPKEEKP